MAASCERTDTNANKKMMTWGVLAAAAQVSSGAGVSPVNLHSIPCEVVISVRLRERKGWTAEELRWGSETGLRGEDQV